MLTPIIYSAVYSETSPPVEIADKIVASMPHLVMAGVSYRTAKTIAELDK